MLPFPAPSSPASDASAVLCGLGTWLPPRVVANDELAARLDTSDEWIRGRTGIRERHVVDPGMSTSDLAVEAGARALKSANLGRGRRGGARHHHARPARARPPRPRWRSRLGLATVRPRSTSAPCAPASSTGSPSAPG